jgi:hypothetical protein
MNTVEQWREQWGTIGRDEADRPWRLGALFNAGRKFVDVEKATDEKSVCRMVEKLVPAVGVDIRQIREYAYVDAAIPASVRSDRLSWRHHREVWSAGVVGARQQKLALDMADHEGWSTRDLRVYLASKNGGGERKEKAPKYDTFRVIPWADAGTAGFRKLFPADKPMNPALVEAVKRECAGLVEELRRVGIV